MSKTVHPQHAFDNAAQIPKIAEWSDFEDELRKAAYRALPNTGQSFAKVYVLTLEFEGCDFDMKTARTRLTNLLCDNFGYKVENYILKSRTSRGTKSTQDLNIEVSRLVADWVASSANDAAGESYGLIFYYSGHGVPDETRPHELKLQRTRNTQGPCVHWRTIQNNLEPMTIENKVLCLLDSCCASLAGVLSNSEILAACSWSDVAPAALSRAFTTKIIASMKALAAEPYFTACQLMEHIKTSDFEASAKSPEPIYLADRRTDALGSFVFHRLPSDPAHGSTGRTALGKRKRTTVFGRGRILLSIQVADETTVPDKDDWKAWLVHIPKGFEAIEIEIVSMCESASAIVIVIIPYTIWLAFEDTRPYTFLGVLKPLPDLNADRNVTQRPGGDSAFMRLIDRPGPKDEGEDDDDDGEPRLSERSRSGMNVEAGLESGYYKS